MPKEWRGRMAERADMAGLLKFMAFIATGLLFCEGLGQIDLSAWGFGPDLKDHIETALQGKELLANVLDFLPIMTAGTGRVVGYEVIAAAPGIWIIVGNGIWAATKFVVRVGILVVLLGFAFIFAEQNRDSLLAFRTQEQDVIVPGQTIASLAPVFGLVVKSLGHQIPQVPRWNGQPPLGWQGPRLFQQQGQQSGNRTQTLWHTCGRGRCPGP